MGEIWGRVVSQCSGLLAEHVKQADHVAISAPNRLVLVFKSGYTFQKSVCERPDNVARFQQLLAQLTGHAVGIEFKLIEDDSPREEQAAPARTISPQQRLMEVADHPMVRRARDLFGAEPTRVTDPPKPRQ